MRSNDAQLLDPPYGPAEGLPDTKSGHLLLGPIRRGETGWLDRYQHEKRLEVHFRL
jgi:hypothetical protein